MTELKIGLAGYYGNNALCDDLIEYAIHQAFSERVDVKWFRLDYGIPPYTGDWSIFDLVVLGGGSLLGMPFTTLVHSLKKAKCPFYVFGTGFRELSRELDALGDLCYMWDRASMVSVRGETSVERLEQLGLDMSKVECLGDPIFLLEPEETVESEYVGGVMRPKGVDLAWMKGIYGYLKGIKVKNVRLFNFCASQGDLFGAKHGYQVHLLSIEDACAKIAKSSFWFGNRLHPFCIALINGVPSIGVEIEFRKVEDVCSVLDYPYWVEANVPFKEFLEKYNELSYNWKTIKKELRVKVNKVRENLREYVQKILEDVC